MNHRELIEQLRKAVISPFDLGPVADAIESLLTENERLKAELAKYRDAPVAAWRYKMISPGWTYSDQEPNRDFFGDAWNRIQVSALIVKPGE